ncbi:TetR/AcrR family transcriptional regulator [Saccharopolyspora erythraea]|uniref:TetR/AcrR family transcriptional regulator n=1 Tax=Saccharopolyspora erythraea TaxID=1836 RepID=UPI001BAE029D|nr:TetR/AcrR family transcriptional regulator [Saccharopolyspora erythraea]QUH05650.1 TetR/AcrR family transcriptional regulator [Saccharopolyspora erythraea]
MTEVTRRERMRAATDQEIRHHARALLVGRGRDAVTLRAIARELGITAPALYRYYDSREDLLRTLCDDICTDLAAVLSAGLEPADADYRERVFAVCRAFRQWALEHPQEFSLVFGSPPAETDRRSGQDQFAGVFLRFVGPLMAEGVSHDSLASVPDAGHLDFSREQRELAEAFAAKGIEVPPEALLPEAVYALLRWWVRLYGHVALEVFGRFPFDLNHADMLFDSMLSELAREIGLQ